MSNESSPTGLSRSRSSSTTSSASEISLKSATSTPSSEVPKEFRIEPDRKDAELEGRRQKSKEHGSNESIGHLDEKPKCEVQRKHRKSEKEGRNRRGNNDTHERKPYEEVPASNIVIKEVSILDEENDRVVLGKQKKKVRSGPKRETKEQKKSQQQQHQQQQQQHQEGIIKEDGKPSMKLSDFSLVEHQNQLDSTFTKVESKAHKILRKGNKVEPAPVSDNATYSGSLDRLDEISISGPRPDGRELTRMSKTESKVKHEHSKRIELPSRKKSQQNSLNVAQQPVPKVCNQDNIMQLETIFSSKSWEIFGERYFVYYKSRMPGCHSVRRMG